MWLVLGGVMAGVKKVHCFVKKGVYSCAYECVFLVQRRVHMTMQRSMHGYVEVGALL